MKKLAKFEKQIVSMHSVCCVLMRGSLERSLGIGIHVPSAGSMLWFGVLVLATPWPLCFFFFLSCSSF